MTVDRENTWNEIVKKGYGYAGNEIDVNHTNICNLSWAALPVAKTVLFCTFDTCNPKISSNTRSPCIFERKGAVFKPEGSKGNF